MGKCTRNFYEDPVQIRAAKLLAAEKGIDARMASVVRPAPVPGKRAAIIGGGPAGATLARLLPRSMRCAVIYRSDLSKPCGGLLSEDAQLSLARYDITLPKDVLVDPQIFAVKTIDVDTEEAQRRAELVMEIQTQVMDEFNDSRMGDTVEVLCDGWDGQSMSYVGRSYAESPGIDGSIYFTSDSPVEAGDFVRVRITGAMDGELTGERTEE